MKSNTSLKLVGLAVFGILIYLLESLFTPRFGMGPTSVLAAGLILVLVILTKVVSSGERDEREHLLQLESDSAALYIVIAGLLAAAIFYPHSELAMAFWTVLGLAVAGRLFAFLYHRYK
jgi:hypothetical protein